MAIKVVITNLSFGQDYTQLIADMKSKGYDVDWITPATYDPAETIKAVSGYDAVIAGGESYSKQALQQLSGSLKLLARHGAGVDNIDIAAATELGIAVTNTPGRNARAVAEYALALMLNLTRNVRGFDQQVRSGAYHPQITRELYKKTVGIVGFGAIGKWLARLLQGFSCRVLVFDKYVNPADGLALGVEYTEMDTLVAESDIVSLHLPLTAETRESIGMDFFKKMKRNAYFINTSRGKVVREAELVEALKTGVIAGAGLDVFANSPIDAGNPLCALDNVVLSPHTSAVTEESLEDMMACSLSDLYAFFDGKTPQNILNPDYIKNKPQEARTNQQ